MPLLVYDKNSINELIENKGRENLYLDFKSERALEKRNNIDLSLDISKDVASFANSDGGNIIYGIKEKNHIPMEIARARVMTPRPRATP